MNDVNLIICAQLIKEQNLTIAFAESATAGRIMAEFAQLKNAGDFLVGGLVCYDARLKEDKLGVSHSLIEKYSPESEEVTEAAAKGLRNFINADIHVAITGLPASGGSENLSKPVGTMFMHLLYKDKSLSFKKIFEGNNQKIIEQTVSWVAGRIKNELNHR